MSVPVRTVVLASRNPDKLRELRQIVAGLPLKVVSSEDFPGLPEVIEDGTTALGNATRKALVTAAYTGEIAVADDTSFQVRTLGGLPDVFASRFAGPEATYADNAALVLELVRAVPLEARDARFEASLVWIDPQPPAGLKASAAAPEHARWLHNPFARSIGLAASGQAAEAFWNELCDRRRIWSDYRAAAITLPVGWGADTTRAVEIVERLVAPYRGGGRPKNAPAEAVWLPDTRLWTASGPDDQEPPATMIAPEGLPPDAPGRSVSKPLWLELAATGRLPGRLTRQPVGSRGFGYDPIFMPVGEDRTLAELAPDEKNAISHRGRALRRLLAAVARVYGEG